MKQMIDYSKLEELVKDIDIARALRYSMKYHERFDAVVYSDMHNDTGYALRYAKNMASEIQKESFERDKLTSTLISPLSVLASLTPV